jgi:adenosine deaminase
MPYSQVFKAFSVISGIVNSEQKVEDGTAALCRSLLDDGMVYAEIRTTLKDLGTGAEGYLQAVLRGIGREPSLQAAILLSLQRGFSQEKAQSTIDLALQYRELGVVGIDLSGDSTEHLQEHVLLELIRAKQNGLYVAMHMGEAPVESCQLRLLELVQPDRIGHGVFLVPEAEAWILQHKIPIEVCLTSSILCQMVPFLSAHPGLQYYLKGHPIVLSTDDPLIFQTSLSRELELFQKTLLLSDKVIEKFTKSSFNYTFSPMGCPNRQRTSKPVLAASSRSS